MSSPIPLAARKPLAIAARQPARLSSIGSHHRETENMPASAAKNRIGKA